eukprot:TCONS_00045574-protein
MKKLSSNWRFINSILCIVVIILLLFGAPLFGHPHHEHFQSYLDHRDFYMNHFNEMLNRKGGMYDSKHGEYSDRVDTYDHINHEDGRFHDERDDEQHEGDHEHGEIQHEDSHAEFHARKRSFNRMKADMKNIIQKEKTAKQFLRLLPAKRKLKRIKSAFG